MKGLVIKEPWIDLILEGKKTWEIRGSNTKIRGRIALIKSGTGLIYGTAELVDSMAVSALDMYTNIWRHHVKNPRDVAYKHKHAWVLNNPVLFENPIPYKHPQGAVIWVNLPEEVGA